VYHGTLISMEALPRKECLVDGPEFPPGFVWGAATAAYQIEGATAEDGRGESIWDHFSRLPGRVRGGDTGDRACDHYHRYREDVAIMAELGLGAYRFSIAWPRIVPTGTGQVNAAGLDFYDRLVDELLSHGIAPHATLYHWDLPQALENAGGWPVRRTAKAFADYAGIVAKRLGDRVGHFATLNEPYIVADHGYRNGQHAPGRTEPRAALAAAHHLLVAHALAVAAIRAAAPSTAVGIVLNFEPKHPATTDMLDLEAAIVAHDQANRWFLDPITGRGYPEDGARAWDWDQGEVLPGDMQLIAAPIDFLGVNYYSHEIVRSPLLPRLEAPATPEPERTGMGWLVHPAGLTEVLRFVASRTGDLPLYVTENGAAYPLDEADPTRDPERVAYLERHVDAVRCALDLGLPVRGYFVWSLLDNFEWAHGYTHRFGIVHVDYETMERQVRDSGRFWSSLARSVRPTGESDQAGADGVVHARH
jgi:beta-glucosidase